MPQDLFKIAQTWQGGGYLTFIVSTIKKIIVSINTFNMFFPIATTSFPDLLSVGGWHNRPAFTLFSVLPYRIIPTKFIILHFYLFFNDFLLKFRFFPKFYDELNNFLKIPCKIILFVIYYFCEIN